MVFAEEFTKYCVTVLAVVAVGEIITCLGELSNFLDKFKIAFEKVAEKRVV